MKTLNDFNFKNKRVLVRCDFNVRFDEKGNIFDDFRIRQSIPTLKYLIEKEAKVILMSHLGDPGGKVVKSLSLNSVGDKLIEYLDLPITKAPDCIGKKIENLINKMQPGQILLLENLRFHKEEEEGDLNFAKELAKLGDIFINDAFGACHRAHASIVGIPKYLPSGAGSLLEKEIEVLSQVLDFYPSATLPKGVPKPQRPLVVIIGGIKIETKIKLIEQFLKIADQLLLGSKLAESILSVKGILIARAFPKKKEVLEKIERIDLTSPKLHLPIDGQIALAKLEEKYHRVGNVGSLKREEEIFDIGPETIKIFSQIIKSGKTIIWNGPLGMFEKEPFDRGTKEIVDAIVRNYSAFKIAGGGETVEFINKLDLAERFDHISTGGGAMLDFLAGEKLPGIAALNNSKIKSQNAK